MKAKPAAKEAERIISTSSDPLSNDLQEIFTLSTVIQKLLQQIKHILRNEQDSAFSEQLLQLSLTVAAYEQTLISFTMQELRKIPLQTSAGSPSSQASTLYCALKPLLPPVLRYPVLKGGIGTLIRQSIRAFKDTIDILEEPNHPYVNNTQVFIAATALLTMYKHRCRIKTLWPWLSIPAIAFIYSRRPVIKKLRVARGRIVLMLRLFIFCQRALKVVRRRSSSTSSNTIVPPSSPPRLLIDTPKLANYDDDMKNAAMLLQERVPLPREFTTYATSNDFGMRLFKRVNDTFCASSGAASSAVEYFGSGNVIAIMLAIFLPFFMVRPKVTAAYATRLLMDRPDNYKVIYRAWTVLGDSRISRTLNTFIAPKLAVRREFKTSNGNSFHVFSSRTLSDVRDSKSRRVIFYVHGGGWFARFFGMDILNLSRWAVTTGAVIIYPDYTLTPEGAFPIPVNESLDVYDWAVSNATALGFTPSRVAVFGESAGGNIATSMCFQLALRKRESRNDSIVILPDALLLCYPALNLHYSASPSRFLFQNDPVLPVGILKAALNLYYPQHFDSHLDDVLIDPFASPGDASDEYLSELLPHPTSLVVGDLDPLLDDSVDFDTRLRKLGVPGELRILPGITHGMLNSNFICKTAQNGVDECCSILEQMLLEPKDCKNN